MQLPPFRRRGTTIYDIQKTLGSFAKSITVSANLGYFLLSPMQQCGLNIWWPPRGAAEPAEDDGAAVRGGASMLERHTGEEKAGRGKGALDAAHIGWAGFSWLVNLEPCMYVNAELQVSVLKCVAISGSNVLRQNLSSKK